MRVESRSRSDAVSYRPAVSRGASGEVFAPESAIAANAAVAAGPTIEAAGIDALLALQAFADPAQARRKALRRGKALLDTLDEVRADLLGGRVSEGRLNQLLALVGQAREESSPGLDRLIDDIDLRARVELAKFGRHPAA